VASEWTRAERLALYSLLVAIIAVIVALFIPEFRRILGLSSESVRGSSQVESNAGGPLPQSTTPKSSEQSINREWTVVVQGTDRWKDTDIRVQKGQQIRISATGSVVWDTDSPAVNPDGSFPASTLESPSNFPMPDAKCGSLVMKVGSTKYAVGSNASVRAQEAGVIQLMVNDRIDYLWNNSGSFKVRIGL
jgi:hypothetical protein